MPLQIILNKIFNNLQFFLDTGNINRWDNGFKGNRWSEYDDTYNNCDGVGDKPSR